MADRIIERDSNSVLWAVFGVVALIVLAWLLWSAFGSGPGIPNTGSVQVEAPTVTQ